MLTISANDAADVMAVDTVGMQRYVAAMNEQVAALGLTDSHFDTPVGLDSPTQVASPYDLAVAGLAAYDNFGLFRDIVGQPQIDVPATSGHIQYTLHNLNRLLKLYPPAKGIKPGWTGEAGYCLVALAERNGHRLVLVLMNEPKLYEDARVMFEWGFGQLGIPPLPTPTPQPSPTPHR
jgi:D-alanyl-D-alanine carboxypeptidase